MAVFRVEKSSGYTVMSNHHLRNRAYKLFEYYKKKSCVGNRTDTSALSEWMVE